MQKMLSMVGIWALFLASVAAQFHIDPYFNFDGYGHDIIKREPTYFVLASKTVRPGQVYRVIVTIFRSLFPITVRASIQRNGVEVHSATQECKAKAPETLLIKVPSTSIPGIYKLRVEGNINGVLGGTAFLNETYLEFSQRSMTIFIQTDHPVYKQEQIVRFRAIPITTDLKAFPEAVDVFMLDPNRTIVKRWLSRQTNLGAVSLEYPLSQQPVYGNWTIQVVAQGQVEEKSFHVEEYYQTRFEINVTMPSFFMDMDDYVYGSVEANYTSGIPVKGNLTLIASIEPIRPHYQVYDRPPMVDYQFKYFNGYMDFKIPMKDLETLIPQLDKTKITITAYVGERFLDLIHSGFARAIIFSSNIKLQFLGSSPQVFKPSMPFKAYAALSYQDGSSVPSWRLNSQKLQISPTVEFSHGAGRRLAVRQEKMSTIYPGLWEINMDISSEINDKDEINNINSLTLEAYYSDDLQEEARAQLKLYTAYSTTQRHLHVSTSTKEPKVGEYVIFHVRADYYVEQFSYVILSKGIILFSGQEEMTSSIKTFAVTLSAEMAPTATVVVYSVAREGEVVADSLAFPVNGISRNNFTVALNNKKDKSGDTIEVVVVGRPGSYVGLLGLDRALFDMQSGSEFSHVQVLEKMSSFESGMNGTLKFVWYSPDGNAENIVHFPSTIFGIDTNKTFEFSGLVVFTDANITQKPDICNRTDGYLSCLDGSCYHINKKCDGYNDCVDKSDESGCVQKNLLDLAEFKLHRINHIQRLYDNSWLWHDINIGPLGYYIFNIPVPEIPAQWKVIAFGMNNIDGFGIISKPIQYNSARPFYMNIEMPTRCKQGEQIGIRISIFNFMSVPEVEVLLKLIDSPDYKFVHVEPFGIVESYGPRTSFGEHQHLVFVRRGRTAEVYMPIVPTRLGDINVTIIGQTQIAKDIITKQLHVEADGIPQYRHIAVQLDLSQGAYLIKYLDTNITDTPVVPYRQDRLYIFGSNQARITVVGDVIGPSFPTIPVNATSLLRKPFWCGEQNMFNFAANLYMLLYLRLTGQRQNDIEKQAFKYLNIGYQRQLSYQREDGSFVPFRWNTKPSVWLTAFCARIFHKATFQEWENFLYIDPNVISRAVKWLLSHQSPEGAFYETSIHPYDRKMNPSTEREYDDVKYRNISLTAHVLITLAQVKDLGGEIGSRISTAKRQAQRYLERMLHIIRDFDNSYELAIVAYALTVSNSIDGEEAFNQLDLKMKETSGLRYWAREMVPPPPTVIENNRPYLIPRLPYNYDASNVETTAYALLVHVARQAVIQREIVEWLNTQRLTDGGWASTQDTIIALQAITEYAIQSRLREVTDITVTVEVPSSHGFVKQIHIGEKNIAQQQVLQVPNAWGVVIVKAQGSGVALVQLDVQYNVDWPHLQTQPPVQAFSLVVKSTPYGRNSSYVNIYSCQR